MSNPNIKLSTFPPNGDTNRPLRESYPDGKEGDRSFKLDFNQWVRFRNAVWLDSIPLPDDLRKKADEDRIRHYEESEQKKRAKSAKKRKQAIGTLLFERRRIKSWDAVMNTSYIERLNPKLTKRSRTNTDVKLTVDLTKPPSGEPNV